MALITNGTTKYKVSYLRRFMPEWPARPGESDYLLVMADSAAEATQYAISHMRATYERDTRYSYQIMPTLTVALP